MKRSSYAVVGYLVVHAKDEPSVREIAEALGLSKRVVYRAVQDSAHLREKPKTVAAFTPGSPVTTPKVTELREEFRLTSPPASDRDKKLKKRKPRAMPSPEFLRWWDEYPVKRNRYKAWPHWRDQKLDEHVDVLLDALRFQIQRKKEIRYRKEFVEDFPHGERYLRDRRWHDEF